MIATRKFIVCVEGTDARLSDPDDQHREALRPVREALFRAVEPFGLGEVFVTTLQPDTDLIKDADDRISINVTRDFNPGAESFADFLRDKAAALVRLADYMDLHAEEPAGSDCRLALRESGLADDFEKTGEY